jgi:serine/threonine-protein kinase
MKSCPRCCSRYPADVRYCFVDGAELAETRDPLIGATFAGRYVIEGVIGEGGMATVYRARQTLHDWPCAVKIMKPALASNPTVRERFRREAKSAQMIAHPNVIEIFDQGETAASIPYIVMELLEGETLFSLLRRGNFGLVRAIPILIQMARGIARAHDLGVVHRDLKPDNVVICRRPDGSDLAKILDFGIARTRTDTHLTHSGELFGTPQYMAPERMTRNESGPSVDLYSFGVVLFEVTTGRLPFMSADPTTLLIMHMTEKAPAPRSIDPAIPEELDALVVQLLEKDPGARPVDAHRIERDLVALARRLRCAVPPDPEDDVSASRRSQTSAVLDDITTEWTRRLEVFERMLAHPVTGEALRKALSPTLADVRTLVRRLAGVRSSTRTEQRALEGLDERGRDSRQRFGAAVDALGLDASKAKEEIRVSQAQVDESTAQSKRAAEHYAEASREVILWEGRSAYQEPHPALARAHRTCAEAVDLWSAARQTETDARAALSERERKGDDLSYQIGVLRAALAEDEQVIERERRFVRERLVALDAQADRIELDVLELATRLCEPLRIIPELGTLFRQLESEATVPA